MVPRGKFIARPTSRNKIQPNKQCNFTRERRTNKTQSRIKEIIKIAVEINKGETQKIPIEKNQ